MFSTRNQQFIFCINDSYHSFGKTKLQHAQYKMWYRHTACKDAHTHTQLYISICTHSPVLRSSLMARSSLQRLPRVPALEWSWTSRCHGLTHTLSLFVARPPPPSPSRFPLPCSPLLCSSSLCLKCNKTPPPTTKKVSLDRFLFLNSEKCVKNSAPFTQWLQLSLCPGKHKRS